MPVFPPMNLGVDIANGLVTFLLSVETDLIQIFQNDCPRLSLPRPLSLAPLMEMFPIFYGLMACMLCL